MLGFGAMNIDTNNNKSDKLQSIYLFLAFDFSRFCVAIRFFHPKRPMTSDFDLVIS